MEKIHKKISLEQFKTRYPLTYPSLKDGDIKYVTKNSLIAHPNANYDSIPLGISESICGDYSNFTTEMDALYHGQVINYKTLERWFFDFQKYYSLIHAKGCSNVYASAEQYYKVVYGVNGSALNRFISMDDEHKKRGGDKFYSWLTKNYFILADLKYLYKEAKNASLSISLSYGEWLNCLDSLKKEFLCYPDACELLRKMKAWKREYNDIECRNSKNCCDCVNYKNYGNDDMITILQYWVDAVSNKISVINNNVETYQNSATIDNSLIENIDLKISLKKQIADFGNYTMFCKEYDPVRDYLVGEVCLYDNDVYYLSSLPAHTYNDTKQRNTINLWTENSPNGWYSYIKQYRTNEISKTFSEIKILDTSYKLSGRTSSCLESFLWSVDTVDNLGNILPGHFEPYSGSSYVQPAESSWLDLEYEIGKTNNLTWLGTSDGVDMYAGDILSGITLFMKDISGNVLSATTTQCKVGDKIASKVDDCLRKEQSLEDVDVESVVYADFIYLKNTQLYFNEDGEACPVIYRGTTYGVKYTEHCTLEKMITSYHLSENELYPLNYYKVIRDVEEQTSQYTSGTVNVNMSDFEFTPSIYSIENSVAGPMIRREELLGITGPENVTDTIYIDRGYATVLDQHLRMGDITSFETLERYGNSSLNIINSQEQII